MADKTTVRFSQQGVYRLEVTGTFGIAQHTATVMVVVEPSGASK